MSLFESASLVVTPNGTKASKLYSVKPTDGSGDMTVVRATTATRVNSSGVIESVATNVPRLDYTGSTCPSVLIEPQRTNLALRSEEFDNASWTKSNISVSANLINSPDGTQDADKLIEDSLTNQKAIFNSVSSTSSIPYTFSLFLKSDGSGRNARIGIFDSSFANSGYILFNSVNGTLSNQGTNGTGVVNSSSVVNYGNGWYRVSITVTLTATTIRSVVYLASGNNTTYAGNGTSGVYIWGAQLEAGSNATSYIPTTTATVTRNVDLISKTGISSLIGQTEGTLYAEVNNKNWETSNRIFVISDGSASNSNIITHFFILLLR